MRMTEIDVNLDCDTINSIENQAAIENITFNDLIVKALEKYLYVTHSDRKAAAREEGYTYEDE